MDTKAKTKLWLLQKNPPIFNESGAQGFKCAFPPTGEDVLLQVLAYKRFLTTAKSGREVRGETATAMATEDLVKWWLKTGIPHKSAYGIEKMIVKLSSQYKNLVKSVGRTSSTEQGKRNKFLEDLRRTFWVVDGQVEEQMAQRVAGGTASARDSEDHLYLQGINGFDRRGTLGSFDTKLAKRYERSERERISLQTKRPSSSEEPLSKRRRTWDESREAWEPDGLVEELVNPLNGDIPVEVNCQASDSTEFNPEENISTRKYVRRPAKNDAIPREAFLICDKYRISNRGLTELAAVFMSAWTDFDTLNLSVKTTERRRRKIRIEEAKKIIDKQLQEMSEKFYVLHWDSKKLKAQQHCDKDVERIAVVLTGKVLFTIDV